MAFAVELYFDTVTDESIRRAWKTLAGAGIGSPMPDSGHRPHVSLAVSNGLGKGACEALASFAASVPPFALTLPSLGVFPTSQGVVFLGVTVTKHLLDLHEEIHRCFQKYATDPWEYYRVGRWVPHCTLAFSSSASQLAEAVSICKQIALPIHAQVKEIGVVAVSPARCDTLCSYRLGGASDDG